MNWIVGFQLLNVDLIISDGNGMSDTGHGHIGINGSIKVFEKLKPNTMVLTHFKHDYSHRFISNYVEKFVDIKCAYDGMEIKLS